MHGLINRSLECFLRDTYGNTVWQDVASRADLPFDRFEAMLDYDDRLTYVVLLAASDCLSKSRETLLEDLGTYLVSNPNNESLRRLLRFGGETYIEFLHSLDDLNGRAKLALPELELPRMTLHGGRDGNDFRLVCTGPPRGFGRVMRGVLRAMADDYGALVLLKDIDGETGCEEIAITLIQSSFSGGRDFRLAGPVGV
ncbi:heme NO-binding domain-containing protein [Profundibacter sp.]|uniref:heme NO-binding domain-containing protein n=1 Tax=Profundibacter sp. TaxID=3101071 RepID=UPI003D10FB64